MRHQHLISFFALLTCLPVLVYAENPYKPFPEGVFQEGIFIETLPNGKDVYENKTMKNWLRIEKMQPYYGDLNAYFVNVQYVTYTPAHTYNCFLSGMFTLEEKSLVFDEELQPTGGCKLRITYDKDKIIFHDPEATCRAYCGLASIFDKATFPLRAKTPPKNKLRK